MYEDSWYSFVPDVHGKQDDGRLPKSQHRRRESLLKQPTDGGNTTIGHTDPLAGLFEESTLIKSPPKATVARRAKSYSDFYRVARAQLLKNSRSIKVKDKETTSYEIYRKTGFQFENIYDAHEDELLDASQEEFRIYKEQLALSRRHLDGLLQDTTLALDLLASLSGSFKSVEAQTTAFQAQCEDLLGEQKRIKHLSEEVGTGLQYYAYLEPITRRLNAPGASSVIGDDGFVEMLINLDACIEFMIKHPEHRESEVYLTRYKSLLTRTLGIISNMFANSVKRSAAEAKSAEAKRRKDTGELTMTSIYLMQDPQSVKEVELLRDTIEHLLAQAKKAIDMSHKKTTSAEWSAYRSYLAIYEEGFKIMTQEYINTRILYIPDIVGDYLTKTLPAQFEPAADFPRYARECLIGAVEICEHETYKFVFTFASNLGNMQYKDPAAPILLSLEKGKFKDYLVTIAMRVFDILQPHLLVMDIFNAVEIAIWLNSHVYDRNMSGDLASSHSDEEDNEERGAILGQARSVVAGKVNSKFIGIIFGRIREILLKDVERYVGKADDFVPRVPATQSNFKIVDDGTNIRLEKALGLGVRAAYPPVKTACRLLVLVNDLTFEYSGENDSSEVAYEILYQTCTSITRGANILTQAYSQMDGRMFAIKNFVLLKNLVLAYEISGSHRASVLDFTDLWATFAELRVRGGLFDIASYYNLLRSGNLFPKVVENVQDARIELDGLLRENITKFREECANMVLKDRTGGNRGTMTAEEQIKKKLAVVFPQEEQLREGLWDAVQLLVDEKRRGQ